MHENVTSAGSGVSYDPRWMAASTAKIGLLWRAEWDPAPRDSAAVDIERCRLRGMFAAFSQLGVSAEPVVYCDDRAAAVRDQLLQLDGVLVWVNPIQDGRDRSTLDALLRDVAQAGVFVSAHPDVILKIATKQVLADTAHMSWSAPIHVYRSHEQLNAELPGRLAARGPLVLKQHRGMSGAGVWKVELNDAQPGSGMSRSLLVQHAEKGSTPQMTTLEDFLERCGSYFAGEGRMVEQPFQPRLAEGLIRVYLSHDQVVGFCHQYPTGLLTPEIAATLPAGKAFLPPTEPDFQRLRTQAQTEWIPQLQQHLGVQTKNLPVIWDADFLLGPKQATGQDSYILCEINASSTFTFPEAAMPAVARAALRQIRARRRPLARSAVA